jgi:two-component system response regulator CpxR
LYSESLPLKETSMGQVLIIDNDRGMCEFLSDCLVAAGFRVDVVDRGKQGVEQALRVDYDLILLDVMLPDGDGFEVLRRLRSRISTPVIILTARDNDVDMIVGLEMGADDYLSKPVNPRALIARIRAVLRRARAVCGYTAAPPNHNTIKVGDVEINIGARAVVRSGETVELTSVEFNLLHRLLRTAGELVSREHLIKEVLGRSLSPSDRSIDVHVSKLRKKLGNNVDGTERIKTIRNEGYLYVIL